MGALVSTGSTTPNAERSEGCLENGASAGMFYLGVSRDQVAVEGKKSGRQSQNEACRGYPATSVDG